jgi:trehalose 6-phosphate synthase
VSESASRLIVASNRLPVVLEGAGAGQWQVKPAVGGLVTALLPVLRCHGGTWVGWSGIAGDDEATIARHLDAFTEHEPFRFAGVALSGEDVHGFYRGFCNEIVWPLFHDLFSNCVFEPDYWRRYQAVNRRFAEVIAQHTGPRDVIWVQDYHLMGVATELREMGLHNRIGFFLHVPFPGPDIFLKLPWRQRILEGLLDFNQLGFQSERDQRNFLACVHRLAGPVEQCPDANGICLRPGAESAAGHPTRELVASSFPISIDFREFAGRADSQPVQETVSHLRHEFRDRCLVMGLDRLDYSKGLPQKLAAFRLVLERFPEMRRRITFAQHVVPSREDVPDYQRQRLEIEHLVSEINGAFSEPGWVPVHYYYHTLCRDDLLAWYRCADIALITPLKDGMNLVAKEFCACHVDERGVLILSEFAGAAAELGGGALLVNPYDVEGVADSIRLAYQMGDDEQHRRMRRLRGVLRDNDVHHWADRCLAASAQGRCRPLPVPARAADPPANPDAAPRRSALGV